MSRREDGFRLADRNQVRIESLEKKLRRAIEERDLARSECNQAKRLSLALGRSLEEAQHAAAIADQRASAARTSLEAVLAETKRELQRMQSMLRDELERRTIGARVRALFVRGEA